MSDSPAIDLLRRRPWARWQLPELLAAHGLDGLPEQPFPHDGWSGSTLTMFERGDRRFILKRTSARLDWIVRATRDDDLREAWFASALVGSGPGGIRLTLADPYLGAAADGDGAAILMADLSAELLAWERPGHEPVVDLAILDDVLATLARLHLVGARMAHSIEAPWCPLAERLGLLTRPTAARYQAEGNPVGERFLAGWDAFERAASTSARDVIGGLSADPAPLVAALGRLPATFLHGDMKLANVATMTDGIGFIDWQMALRAPVAVELGWLLVSNVALLPEDPDALLERYRAASETIALDLDVDAELGDWETQKDLAILVGLLLRGWRKGLDAEAGLILPTGVSAIDDMAWWSDRAVEAAARRL
jgi:hypothetical protein